MPGVLFLQTDWLEHLGPLYLSAFLKTKNVQSNLIISRSPEKILKTINSTKPELLALSLSTAGYINSLLLIKKIKSALKIPVVIGGPHPTFFPQSLASPEFDFIIRGEAEQSLYQLILALRGKKRLDDIPGLGYKKNGELKYNPPGKLIEDIDQIPFPNRSLYLSYGFFKRLSMRRVITARGCPFSCRYCYNSKLKGFYSESGKYLRQRTPENIIAELKQLLPIARTINFVDDSFGLNQELALELLDRYQKEINLPFIVNLRPDYVNDQLAKALAKAGCYCAQIGIESANDYIREKLLGRKISKEQIIFAVKLLKEKKIKVLSYNMLALPGETLEMGLETIKLNRNLKIDFPRFSIFQPYPGTELADEIIKNGLATEENLMKNFSSSYFRKSPLNLPEIKKLQNLEKLFLPAIKLLTLEPFIKKLTSLPPNPLFDLIFLSSIAIQYRKATNLSTLETVEYGIRNLSLYFQ